MKKVCSKVFNFIHPSNITWMGKKDVLHRTGVVLGFVVIVSLILLACDSVSGLILGFLA